MGSRYLTDCAEVLRAAGLAVAELDGWQSRARSSGGYDGAPWAVYWHHTASGGDGAADAEYCTYRDSDKPVTNVVVGRDGVVHLCAAGATNCNGKGGPHTLPDGRTIPTDGANSRVFAMEISNNGVGQDYPRAQIDAAFAVSVAVCAAYIGAADQVVTHQVWAPTRKIDPATAAAVAGPWRPGSCTSSGTWDLADLRAECLARAAAAPPTPTPPEEPPVLHIVLYGADGATPVMGPAIVGPGYWHYSRSEDEAYLWTKLYGPPRAMDNEYDFTTTVRSHALQPDDAAAIGG